MTIRHYGQGPWPAMAVHCSLAHGGEWSALGKALGDLLTMTAVDLPGHGRAADWDPANDLADVAEGAVLGALPGAGPVDLIGHSFGGVVALRLALHHPGRVRRLVLFEPTLFAAAAQDGPAGAAVAAAFLHDEAPVAEALAAGDREGAARLFTARWGTGVPWAELPELQRRYITDRIHLIPAADPALRADAGGLLRPGLLEALDLPVLVVDGGASPPIVAAICDALQRRLPRVQRVSVPGAGHMLPVTHADVAADALRDFLSRE